MTAITTPAETAVKSLDGTDIEALITRHKVLDEMLKDLKNDKEDVDQQIKDLMGEAEVGTVGGVVRIKYTWRNQTTANVKKIREEFSDIADKILRTTRYRRLDVS